MAVINMPGRGPCPDCEVMVIQGVRCHESGCPSAWKDAVRECVWCDQEFQPLFKQQIFCSEDCDSESKEPPF